MFYYFLLYSKISEYLETSFEVRLIRLYNRKYRFLILAYGGANSKNKVIEYFSKYPLIGKVSLDFELWEKFFLNRSQEENSTQFKALLASLKIQNKNLFTAREVCKNLSFYLPHLGLGNRINYCTNSKLLFKPRSYCTQIVKINYGENKIAWFFYWFYGWWRKFPVISG